MTAPPTRAEVCAVALAETFRDDGELLASGIGPLPALAARLARASFAPRLLVSDGVASLVDGDGVVEGWLPYRAVFDVVWSGRRHVIMGAAQLDRFGNQNLACIGDWRRPRAQLLGMRGAPGNTINHPTTYWVPAHSRRVFVDRVDVVSGVGSDRATALGAAGRFFDLRRIVTNLCVLDLATPERTLRLASLHPGVTVAQVVDATGFALVVPAQVPETRAPSADELRLIREVLDPTGAARREVPA